MSEVPADDGATPLYLRPRVGQPYFLNPDDPSGSGDLTPFPPDDPDDWIGVGVGGLTHRLAIKARLVGGRLRVVALRVDDEQVVTARTLRKVPLGAIEDMLARALAEHQRDVATSARRYEEELQSLGDDVSDSYRRGVEATAEATQEWVDELQAYLDKLETSAISPAELGGRGRGARPPSEEEYQAFARIYLERLRTDPRRALSSTAKAAGMDRSTVYRWIKECRKPERLYLPPKEAES